MYLHARFIFGLALAAAAGVNGDALANADNARLDPGAIRAKLISLRHAAQERDQGRSRAADSSSAKDFIANPYRVYPPSCLNDGLPGTPSGPTYSVALLLGGDPTSSSAAEQAYQESVTVTIWRVNCSYTRNSSNQIVYQSATLLRIIRPASMEGNTSLYPIFPGFAASQNGSSYNVGFVRIVQDPNTLYSTEVPYDPIVSSLTYVLENVTTTDTSIPLFNFNGAFSLAFFSTLGGTATQTADLPAYIPDSVNYPSAFLPLPINGYMSTSWYDPAVSAQGILTNVYEIPGTNPIQRLFFYTWYTYDETQLGLPFWLVGSASLGDGANSVTVPTSYFVGGDFAGDHSAVPAANSWGTVIFSFPSCNEMTVSYNGHTDTQTNGPLGQGLSHMVRLGSINSLTCD